MATTKGNGRTMKLPDEEFEKYTEYLKYPFPHVIYYEYLIDRLIARMNLPPDASFLDIGCGTGSLLVKMGSLGYKGIGIDLEDLSVQISKGRVSKFEIEVYQLDLFDLHGSFDVIFANSVLEHIENDGEALSKIRNLLKPEGYFLFEVPGNMKLFGDHDRALGHFRRYEKNDLIHKIEEAGLEIVILWSYGFSFLSRFYRLLTRRDVKERSKWNERINTSKSAFGMMGWEKISGLYPIYSKLMFLFKFQNFFLNCNIFRNN